jgi:molybdopterin-binding protein
VNWPAVDPAAAARYIDSSIANGEACEDQRQESSQGKIVEVKKGATTAHVRLDVSGTIVTASITNEAVDELKLKVGGTVLYPKEAAMDLRAEAREFHRLFYGVAPGDAELDALLEGAKG